MKLLSVILLLFYLLLTQACEQKQHVYVGLVRGNWRLSDSLQQEIFEFRDGHYTKHGVYDTAMYNSEGLYFINENKKRNCVTLTLVPDDIMPFDPEMVIMTPCENYDIVSINGEKMVVVKASRIAGALGNVHRADLDTLWKVE